jgi:guanylate kinase
LNAIEFIDFNTFYGSKPVLQNINLGFDSNSITAIIGPSGCGKTTLLRSINRTAEMERGYKSQGEIQVFGESIMEVKSLSYLRRQVGMVYQTPDLNELARRLCSRGEDSQESIDLRLATCEAEMAHIKYYDYLVVNNDVNEALEKVRSIIQAERCSLNNIIVG